MIESQNISTIGTTTAGLGISTAAKPKEKDVEVREAIAARSDDDDDDARDDGADKAQAPGALVSPPAQPEPRARIGYSFEEKQPYIEILNPRTGDVIQRFPAEDAEDELRNFTHGDSGVFIDRIT